MMNFCLSYFVSFSYIKANRRLAGYKLNLFAALAFARLCLLKVRIALFMKIYASFGVQFCSFHCSLNLKNFTIKCFSADDKKL